MKSTILKWLFLATIYCLSVKPTHSKTIVKLENGVYHAVNKPKSANHAKDTGKVYQDAKGLKYKIMQSESGAYFVIRTSQKTGKQYRQYLKL